MESSGRAMSAAYRNCKGSVNNCVWCPRNSWAVVQRRLDMVQLLLARGAAIEFPDDQPWTTPRFWAKHLDEPALMLALAD
jgi:hypothetical protein